MSEMTMREMIERYVYDVVRRLPQSQREDISRELRTLIDDMMEERADSGKTEQENAEEVLKELGSPFALAGKYRDSKKYLIGPAYYEQYWFVLKIVLIAVTVGMVIASKMCIRDSSDSVWLCAAPVPRSRKTIGGWAECPFRRSESQYLPPARFAQGRTARDTALFFCKNRVFSYRLPPLFKFDPSITYIKDRYTL